MYYQVLLKILIVVFGSSRAYCINSLPQSSAVTLSSGPCSRWPKILYYNRSVIMIEAVRRRQVEPYELRINNAYY